MKKRVLVTGGAGFIGSHLVDYLICNGNDVTVIDDLSGGIRENVNSEARFIEGSITNQELVDSAVKGKDVIYHLAAYAAEGLSHYIRRFNYTNNLIGSVNLINAAIKEKVPNFLFTSSMAVYGTGEPPFDEEKTPAPEDPYGIAKAAVEQDLNVAQKTHGLNFVIIRPHNVYGPRQFLADPYRNVIGIFMNRIMQGKPPMIYGDGEQTRAFSYIGDVISPIAKAPFIEGAQGQIINVGAAKPYTLNQLAEEVLKAMGSNLKPIYCSERYEVKHAHSTTEKSEKILGYKDETPLTTGLTEMATWAKTCGPMNPIVWGEYELTQNLPNFWRDLNKEFSNTQKRKDITKL